MATRNLTNNTIEIDGREFDIETVSEAMQDVLAGHAPVGIMDDNELREGVTNRILWSLAAVILIAQDADADNCIKDIADASILHLEQARDMFRKLSDTASQDPGDDDEHPGPVPEIDDDIDG